MLRLNKRGKLHLNFYQCLLKSKLLCTSANFLQHQLQPCQKAAGIEKGSGEPNKNNVAKVPRAKVVEIAEMKMKDLNAASIEAATSMIEGTARSMGIEVVA